MNIVFKWIIFFVCEGSLHIVKLVKHGAGQSRLYISLHVFSLKDGNYCYSDKTSIDYPNPFGTTVTLVCLAALVDRAIPSPVNESSVSASVPVCGINYYIMNHTDLLDFLLRKIV